MGEFFGDLERLAADLYPYRWYIVAAIVVGLAAIGAVGYRVGWHLWVWRHRLPVAAVGTPVVVASWRSSGTSSCRRCSRTLRWTRSCRSLLRLRTARARAVRPRLRRKAPVRRRPLPRRRRPPIRRRQCRPRVRRRSRPPRLQTRLPLLHLTPVGCRRRRGRPRRCLSLPPRPCQRRLRNQPLRQRPRPRPLRVLRRLPRHCPRRLRRQPPRHPGTRRLSHLPRRPCPGQYRRPARPRLPRLRRRRHRRRQLRQCQPPPPCQPPRRLPVLPRSRLPRRPLELPSS